MNNFRGETLFEEKGFPKPLPKTFSNDKTNDRFFVLFVSALRSSAGRDVILTILPVRYNRYDADDAAIF
jgi:hypothetical protein